MPLFSRLGAYDRDRLDALAWGPRPHLFEYWGHEASLIPVGDHPLYRWRMARALRGEGTWGRLKAFAGERRDEAMTLLKRISDDGPLSASDLDGGAGQKGWWAWSDGKAALEWLFWSGQISARARKPSFERVYDITERVLPADVLNRPTPSERDAHRALLPRAAAALGLASAAELRDYHRLPAEGLDLLLRELVDEGTLETAKVKGQARLLYASASALAAAPLRRRSGTLLAPFDPLIWSRDRAERLFGLSYRIEIYTPAHKRRHGYYVLPFLLGDRFAARTDLKADRAQGRLVVRSAYAEPAAPGETAEALAQALRALARWLALPLITVEDRGDLAPGLAAVLKDG